MMENDKLFTLFVGRFESLETAISRFEDKLERMISSQGFVCSDHYKRLDEISERTRANEVNIENTKEAMKRRSALITSIGCTIASILGGLLGKYWK